MFFTLTSLNDQTREINLQNFPKKVRNQWSNGFWNDEKLWPTMTSAFSLRPEFLNEKSLFLNGTKCRAKQRFQLRTFLKTLLASYAVQLMVNWFSSCVLLWRTDYRGSWLIVKVLPWCTIPSGPPRESILGASLFLYMQMQSWKLDGESSLNRT